MHASNQYNVYIEMCFTVLTIKCPENGMMFFLRCVIAITCLESKSQTAVVSI